MKFNNIPLEILNLEVCTLDDDEMTLQDLLESSTQEDIIDAKFVITYDQYEEPELESFIAWTDNYILVLQNTTIGAYLGKHERHPTHTSED